MNFGYVLARLAAALWIWMIAQFLMSGDMYDVIPIIILGLLLVSLDSEFHKENMEAKKIHQTIGIQTDPKECDVVSTQTEEEMFRSSAIKKEEEKIEESTQVEKNIFVATSHETEKEKEKNQIEQIAKQTLDDKEIYSMPCLSLDSAEQAKNIKNWTKIMVPVLKQMPKPTIPPTNEFLKYHQVRHKKQKMELKFKSNLETILEDNEDEDLSADESGMENNFFEASMKKTEESSIDLHQFIDEDANLSELQETESGEKLKDKETNLNEFTIEEKFWRSLLMLDGVTSNSELHLENIGESNHRSELINLTSIDQLKDNDSEVHERTIEDNACEASMSQTREWNIDDLHFLDVKKVKKKEKMFTNTEDGSYDDLVFLDDITRGEKKPKKICSFKKKFKNFKKFLLK